MSKAVGFAFIMLVDTVRISRPRRKCGNRPAASRICHKARVEADHTLGYRGLSIQGPTMRKPLAVASSLAHSGRVIQVSTERLRYANGREYDIGFVRAPGAAGGRPIAGSRGVCLVRRSPHGVADFLGEIPAGNLDAGEPPEVC